MPGIKSVTITVEFADGSTEVATIDRPREVTFTNRANVERGWGERLDLRTRTAPSYDFDLFVKDAPGFEWRAHPAPAPRVVCDVCDRPKGCTADCEDMNCEHCYCGREGRDG